MNNNEILFYLYTDNNACITDLNAILLSLCMYPVLEVNNVSSFLSNNWVTTNKSLLYATQMFEFIEKVTSLLFYGMQHKIRLIYAK